MPKLNRNNIDRKTNQPQPSRTEGLTPDLVLNRAMQTRRDDDVVRTTKRTLYDVDYAIKWYLDNEIQPQIVDKDQLVVVPIIFANGEKWDNTRRLGYMRDEKGSLQSPIIALNRTSVTERDSVRTLDVNRNPSQNYFVHRSKYNSRNRYEADQVPLPINTLQSSETVYVLDIPKYVTIEYEMMIWCDFTTQMNSVIDQILPYGRFLWGNDFNKFETAIGQFSMDTVNTVGEDRLVRATVPLTVHATLLSEQEARVATLKKMYSIKKVSYDAVLDVDVDVFATTHVPVSILQVSQQIFAGGTVQLTGGSSGQLDASVMLYLTQLQDKYATIVTDNNAEVQSTPAINPLTGGVATKNEFDVYINGQYIDKITYTWTPSNTITQTIVFDANILGYTVDSSMVVVINGRWL
jgi:hypothetical protein